MHPKLSKQTSWRDRIEIRASFPRGQRPEIAAHIRAVSPGIRFKGHSYRSLLEAKWATFLDAAGIPFFYEVGIFDLGPPIGFYVPTFYLPEQGTYLEIAPAIRDAGGTIDWPDEELFHLQNAFESRARKTHIVLAGEPGDPDPDDNSGVHGSYTGFTSTEECYWFCECASCGSIGIEFEGRADRVRHSPVCPRRAGALAGEFDRGNNSSSKRLLLAYDRARDARFELDQP